MALEFDAEKTDRYGRLLAYVWTPGGTLFNEFLVEQGYAQVATFPPNVKYEEWLLASVNMTERGAPRPSTIRLIFAPSSPRSVVLNLLHGGLGRWK